MKTSHTQAGKGLSGFIIGLLLATAVIAGVLFFLNKNKTPFRQPEVQIQSPQTPEILTPGGSEPQTASSAYTLPPQTGSDVLGAFIASATASDADTGGSATSPQPVTDQPAGKPQSKPKPKLTAKKPAPVSPEQILNSGSLEKAQQAAKQTTTAAAASTGKVTLQIGSFKDQAAADAQRAKLAILGVDTQVIKGSANGNTVYRVQTGHLSRPQAEQTTQHLRQNQIDSLMRTAP